MFSNDSIVGMIVVRAVELSAVHDREIDHRIYAGSRNARTFRSFSLPPLPSSPSFFSHAWRQTYVIGRLFLYRAQGAVNNLLQRFDNRFKMPCPPRFYRSLERDISCGSTRSSSRSPSQFFHARAHQLCSSLVKYR